MNQQSMMKIFLRKSSWVFLVCLCLNMPSNVGAKWVVGGSDSDVGKGFVQVDPQVQKEQITGEGVTSSEQPDEIKVASDFWGHNGFYQDPQLNIPPVNPDKNHAWIMVGDVTSAQAWLFEWLSRHMYEGWETIPPGALAIAWSLEIVKQARQALEAAGYAHRSINIDLHATKDKLNEVLVNPRVGALVWVSHGEPGMISDYKKYPINYGNIKAMALTALQEKGIYKLPVASNFPNQRMLQTMKRIRDRAHFGLDYLYVHACLTMQDPILALRMVKSGGRYEGYFKKKLAYVAALTPTMSQVSNMEIPDVHSLLIVPNVLEKSVKSAQSILQEKGFVVDEIVEDKLTDDPDLVGKVHSQLPYEGKIVDKNHYDEKIALFVYKLADSDPPTDADGNSAINSEGDDTIAVWINLFGKNNKTGRIYVGTLSMFKQPKPYCQEKYAGISRKNLQKKRLYKGKNFESIESAKEFVCENIGNKRKRFSSTWGSIAVGDLDGKTCYIEPLGCTIPAD